MAKLGRLCDPLVLRFILLIWGFITLVFGSGAYFGSGWSRKKKWLDNEMCYYNVCSDWEVRRQGDTPRPRGITFPADTMPEPCPHISMEWYFLGAIVLSLIGTVVSIFFYWFLMKDENGKFVLVDCILHGVIALLLLIGVITFIVSAMQAQDIAVYFSSLGEGRKLDEETLRKMGMLYELKLFAAALAVVQVILHLILFVMALIPIIRKWRDKKKGNAVAPEATPASQQKGNEEKKAAPPPPPPPEPPRKSEGQEGKPRGSKKSK